MTQELLTWLSVLAFVIGILALVLEIFVIPGFGVAGVAGILLIGWGVLLLSVDFTQATAALAVALIATVVLFVVGIKVFSKLKLWQRITLADKQNSASGYVAPNPAPAIGPGMAGAALTPLRPAGTVEINGMRLDAVTSGEYIPPGSRVVVVKLEGTRMVVRAAAD
jgi:Membrane-bound serine protease (ClpP class)